MREDLQLIYDSVPPDEPRSRMEPYRELILRWRRQGRTYRKIQTLLAERCSVVVSTTSIFKFVKGRSRPNRESPDAEIEQTVIPPDAAAGSIPGKSPSAKERAAQVEFIRSLNRPAPEDSQPKSGWNFDVDKPRTIHKP